VNAKWLRRALWLAGFAALWLKVLDDPPLATGGYVQDVRGDAATVAMITAAPALLRCDLRDASGTVVATKADERARRRHTFRFDGLAAGGKYTYAIAGRDDGAVVAEGAVRTASADDRAPVRFAFLGDSGAQPWWVWLQRTPAWHLPARWQWLPCASAVRGIGAAVAQWQPDFVLHLGDVVYPEGLSAHYSAGYFRPFAEAMRNAPFYAVLGNHDVMDIDGLQCLDNIGVPPNPSTGDGRFFSIARGPVRILGVDCNTDHVGKRYEAAHPAHRFLEAELAAATEPWIVVASHFPMRSWSRQGPRAELLLAMLPLLAERRVSLYLSGHDHCYQRFDSAGAAEPVLLVSGGGGKNLYDIKPAQPGPRPAVAERAHHWCSAEVQGAELRVTAHGLDGAVLDSFALGLPEGADLAALAAANPGRADRIRALRGR